MSFIERITAFLNAQSTRNKVLSLIVIIALLAGGYWYFIWSPNAQKLKVEQAKLRQAQKTLSEYQSVQRELPRFKREFEKLEREFEQIAQKLPKEKEIPALIDNVYEEISASNLDSVIFAPKGQVQKDIYAEIPIEMEVNGTYYELASFFDRIARLPRIVNARNLDLEREDIKGNKVRLNAKFNVVTFRLLPNVQPPPTQDKGKRKARPKRGKKQG